MQVCVCVAVFMCTCYINESWEIVDYIPESGTRRCRRDRSYLDIEQLTPHFFSVGKKWLD